MSGPSAKLKVVWAITPRGGQTVWSRVGVAWQGTSGALFVRLDALPVSGELCIRDWGAPAETGRDGGPGSAGPASLAGGAGGVGAAAGPAGGPVSVQAPASRQAELRFSSVKEVAS